MSGHDGRCGYIQHLAVAANQRESGVGTALLSRCVQALKQEGILKSHIHVRSSNELAKNYWSNRSWVKRADVEVYSYINDSGENT